MRIKLFIILFLSLVFSGFSIAQEEKSTIRVAISNQNFSCYEHESVKLASFNIIKIIDMSQNTQLSAIEANKTIEITMSDGFYNIFVNGEPKYEKLRGPLLLSSNAELQILGLNRKGTPAKYKGMIEIRNSKLENRFNIINVVDMQSYLRGVVPNEMPVSFGLEALKAQSVAARNYATNAQISPSYDIVDSTASQVYYGINSYSKISDEAVIKTSGIYALHNDKPITALYFSTSAGITDDWDDVFGDGILSNTHPYLKAKYDKQDQKPLKTEADVKEFYSKKDTGLDVNSPKYRWNVEFSKEELEEVLRTTLEQQSKAGFVTPKYDNSKPLEDLRGIKPIKRTQSGKIIELEILSKSGNYIVKKELGIRRVLKKNNTLLPSANFFIETSGEDEFQEAKKEEAKGIKLLGMIDKCPLNYKFIGGGFGHGVGMSQFGAYNLAKQGKKFPEILNHYYTDIKLGSIPKTVTFNDYNIHYKTEFYYDSTVFSEVCLTIENYKNVSDFSFKINDGDFYDLKTDGNRTLKIDVTKYLKEGINTVTFAPFGAENKGKSLVYKVEFQ